MNVETLSSQACCVPKQHTTPHRRHKAPSRPPQIAALDMRPRIPLEIKTGRATRPQQLQPQPSAGPCATCTSACTHQACLAPLPHTLPQAPRAPATGFRR